MSPSEGASAGLASWGPAAAPASAAALARERSFLAAFFWRRASRCAALSAASRARMASRAPSKRSAAVKLTSLLVQQDRHSVCN